MFVYNVNDEFISFVLLLKPGNYVAHLIGHKGPGSLLSSLKKSSLVNDLGAGEQNEERGYSFFDIRCDLTEKGTSK